jgi:hypothetical protein
MKYKKENKYIVDECDAANAMYVYLKMDFVFKDREYY